MLNQKKLPLVDQAHLGPVAAEGIAQSCMVRTDVTTATATPACLEMARWNSNLRSLGWFSLWTEYTHQHRVGPRSRRRTSSCIARSCWDRPQTGYCHQGGWTPQPASSAAAALSNSSRRTYLHKIWEKFRYIQLTAGRFLFNFLQNTYMKLFVNFRRSLSLYIYINAYRNRICKRS